MTNVRLDRFRAAIFAASVVVPELDGISHHQEGNNIYGAYSWITHVVPKSSIEPFVLWRVAPSVAVEGAGKDETGRLDEKAYGFRIRGRTSPTSITGTRRSPSEVRQVLTASRPGLRPPGLVIRCRRSKASRAFLPATITHPRQKSCRRQARHVRYDVSDRARPFRHRPISSDGRTSWLGAGARPSIPIAAGR